MQMPCSDTKRQTPYFLDWNSTNHNEHGGNKFKDTDDFLFYHLNRLSETVFDISLRNVEGNDDVNALPDGIYRVQEASDERLSYDIRVNDHHQWQYHRENGMTKMGIV